MGLDDFCSDEKGESSMYVSLFQNVRQPYKKAFKRHADHLYATVQSKPVEIGASSYVVVGEIRLQHFPLLSHFDVFDEHGVSVNEEIGQAIYAFISRMILVDELRGLQPLLEKQDETEQALAHLTALLNDVAEVAAKQQWDEADVGRVASSWDMFWRTYDERSRALIRLSAEGRSPREKENVDAEATLLSKVFDGLTPMSEVAGEASVDALIQYHYEFGRLRKSDESLERVMKMERGLYRFLTVFIWISFVLVVLLGVILLASGEFDFAAVLPLVLFIGSGSLIKSQSRRRLVAKNHSFLMEQRAVPEEEADEKDQGKPLIEAKVVSLDIMMIFVLFTLVFIAVTIAVLVSGDVDFTVMKYLYAIVAVSLAATIYAPFSRVAKRKMTVTEQAIYLRKEKVSALEAERIVVKNDGRNVHVYVNYNDNPFKMWVDADDQARLKDVLETWCEDNGIAFEANEVK